MKLKFTVKSNEVAGTFEGLDEDHQRYLLMMLEVMNELLKAETKRTGQSMARLADRLSDVGIEKIKSCSSSRVMDLIKEFENEAFGKK